MEHRDDDEPLTPHLTALLTAITAIAAAAERAKGLSTGEKVTVELARDLLTSTLAALDPPDREALTAIAKSAAAATILLRGP